MDGCRSSPWRTLRTVAQHVLEQIEVVAVLAGQDLPKAQEMLRGRGGDNLLAPASPAANEDLVRRPAQAAQLGGQAPTDGFGVSIAPLGERQLVARLLSGGKDRACDREAGTQGQHHQYGPAKSANR